MLANRGERIPPNGKRLGMCSDRRMPLVVGVAVAERCA
jgi:hypothetical protein